MSKPFRVQVLANDAEKRALLKMSGSILETAEFEQYCSPTFRLEIDMAEVAGINSTGIRAFREWAKTVTNPEVRFSFCPHSIISQLNMIMDLFPTQAKVTSFYVPYYSDSGEEKMVLYREGLEFSRNGEEVELKHPEVLNAAGEAMELDVLPEKYFGFLSRFV